ncbi:MAG: Ig-like domain-containing protein [Candidatus Nomurabacteria bacterium]|jgi:hypothetical protein|nr:Ig-like domain-containing protein [Candidatus Nomurabacteria bacterium]
MSFFKKQSKLLAAILAVILTLCVTGCSKPNEIVLTDEEVAFYSALTGGTGSWDWGNDKVLVLTQIGGAEMTPSTVASVGQIYARAKDNGWDFDLRDASKQVSAALLPFATPAAFFRNGDSIETIALEGQYPVAYEGGITYVAYNGRLLQMLSEQPNQVASLTMAKLVERWGNGYNEYAEPQPSQGAKLSDTMLGAYIGTQLWGTHSIADFLFNGFDNWRPLVTNEDPWVTVRFPEYPGTKLLANERLLMTIDSSGEITAYKPDATVTANTNRPANTDPAPDNSGNSNTQTPPQNNQPAVTTAAPTTPPPTGTYTPAPAQTTPAPSNNQPSGNGGAVDSITLSPAIVQIDIGESVNLQAAVYPAGAGDTIVWESDDTAIATVDQNGRVTGKKAGWTIVYAITGGKSTFTEVFVGGYMV